MPTRKISLALALVLNIFPICFAQGVAMKPSPGNSELTVAEGSRLAGLALKCVAKEFPNKPEHVMNDGREVQNPKALHPAFYGCYDWHSSV
ncbi:MAG: DUF2891 family protein, partial [Pyrinomonadaceae bacterium]